MLRTRPSPMILSSLLLGVFVVFAAIIRLAAQEPQTAHGFVTDGAEPVAGAVVRFRGSSSYVLTDARGAFLLPVEDRAEIAAWAPGFYIGSGLVEDFVDSDGGIIELRPHPTVDNPDYAFVSPFDAENEAACANCHRERTGENGGAMPVDEWLLDAHSGSATNPRFLSLYNGTTLDGIAGAPTTYEYDATAGVMIPLAPSMGEAQMGGGFRLDFPNQTGNCATCHVPILALESPYNADPNHAAGVAAEGVTCDFCHKVADVTLRSDDLPDAGLPGVLSMQMLRPPEGEQLFIGPFMDTPGDDIYSALQNESQFCAACHSGRFWDVPIYNSYGEWLESPYSDPASSQTCQDCHMPHAGVTSFVQLPPGDETLLEPRDPQTIFSHRMPGAADQELLENTAALEVDAQEQDDQLQVTVRVTNTGAGHHIPTDNPLRNIILLVQVRDEAGQRLPMLDGSTIPAWGGEGDPAVGYYAGLPGVLYAKVLADAFTGETPAYTYWRPTHLISDNRIPALASDETTYIFSVPANAGAVTVDVRLYLRRAFIDLMDIKAWDTPDILMEQQTVVLP